MAILSGQVAVVAGATRGAGRGIATALGEAGAVVYCTGRSSRTRARDHHHHHAQRPETIEETAERVTAAGGEGIAIVVDHKDPAQVKKLFARIRKEQRRLDILVNVLTHTPVESWEPFWKLDVAEGREQVDGWTWPHITTARYALPMMVQAKRGLVVEIIEQEGIGYHGQAWFDLFEANLKRLAYLIAVEGADHGITAFAMTPGFMRTEAIKEMFGATDDNWKEVAVTHPQAKAFGFIASETPVYAGRAIAAVAADPRRQRWSGGVWSSGTFAEQYDFTDVDGTRPNMNAYLREHHADLFTPKEGVRHWQLAPEGAA